MSDAPTASAETSPRPVFDQALRSRLDRARELAIQALKDARSSDSGWTGELSASALSTATAVTALTLVAEADGNSARHHALIRAGYRWLLENQNADGGWGDTVRSFSNISTTTLVWAAFGLGRDDSPRRRDALARAERWLAAAAGSLEPAALVAAIERRYGKDRTFSIPILTMCALCGRLGAGENGWRHVRQLPFELAVLPQAWFGALRLPVVSYALPALIAIGQVRHHCRPSRNPLMRWLRDCCRARILRKLQDLQPPNGGFLEATPLTSFVTMSLAGCGLPRHPVAERGVAFLTASSRPDGSWPIDTNLATWVTTLAVNAFSPEEVARTFSAREREAICSWLLQQQYRQTHPYTRAAPGGWGWTNLPGGVPDADDTAGAVLALLRLNPGATEVRSAISAGVTWLLGLQNRDGGVPTFCRGWGWLPFDRSSPDITAHGVRAWVAAHETVSPALRRRIERALPRAIAFLRATQRADGTWIPLWFGHQEHAAEENPLYGTTRVLTALLSLPDSLVTPALREATVRALAWLVRHQNLDGGWSGTKGAQSSLEETGLALEALGLAHTRLPSGQEARDARCDALRRGAAWLAAAVEDRGWTSPAPIGFYFAKLWYFERLYPLLFCAGALTHLARTR